jgi:hypothetical protein
LPKRAALEIRLVPSRRNAFGFTFATSPSGVSIRALTLPRAAVFAAAVERSRNIGILRLFAAVAFDEGHIGLEHLLHFLDILLQRPDFRSLLEERKLELEAREDGPQVMR